MSNSRRFAVFGVLTHGVLATCLFQCGCERSEKIETYTVPRHESLQTHAYLADLARRAEEERLRKLEAQQRRLAQQPMTKQRMIGVIILRDGAMWFFKLQADVDDVTKRENEVREFLKSVRFSASDKMEWSLPPNWRQLPGDEMRYATLVLDGQPPLEISVTQLATRSDTPISDQVVANVNRWRGQLSLPPIENDGLALATEKLNLGDSPAFWMNIAGTAAPKRMGMAQPQRKPEQNDKRNGPKVPAHVTPDGWVEGNARLAVLAFQATDGEAKILVTVTSAAGGRLANVNRWRGQLKLNPVSNDEVAANAKRVSVGRLTGEQFEFTNDGETIVAVIVEDHGRTWFIKLYGDAALAERERPHFDSFLKSLKWD